MRLVSKSSPKEWRRRMSIIPLAGNDFAEGPAGARAARWSVHRVQHLEEIDQPIQQLLADMSACGFGDRDLFGTRLALEEALVNAIRHGHRGDPSKSVRVAFSVSPGKLVIEVEDQGPGFNPEQIPDPLDPANLERPGGRGVYLMRCYMTWVKYNARGNRVILCMDRTAG